MASGVARIFVGGVALWAKATGATGRAHIMQRIKIIYMLFDHFLPNRPRTFISPNDSPVLILKNRTAAPLP